MNTVLVTGATGTLGKPTTSQLREAGYDVRALSRRSGADLTTGDLLTGSRISEAVAGADAVVHLATGKSDVAQAKAAIDAAKAAGVGHFVLISIVGIENIPFSYYRGKVEIEEYLGASGMPFTIQRATQFHQFVEGIFAAQRFSPVLFAPRFSFQPISVREVAVRLAELVSAAPAGRVSDIGGPQQRTAQELAHAFTEAKGSRRTVWNLRLPGKTAAGFAAGHNLVPGDAYGAITFGDYLKEKYRD